MNGRFRNRIQKLEAKYNVRKGGGYTLEEICRMMWKSDKQHFLGLTEELPEYRFFSHMFEREDEERERRQSDATPA